jgi:hypothetical protein
VLSVDSTRRPVRPGEWRAVVDAVFHASPNDEQTWLEWKSTLDLRSKRDMATVASKAVIAMANRDPDEAALTVGGIGIIVIGVEPGSVAGVIPVDNADLDQMISLYVGADGPLWRPYWDQYQGKAILIIEVAAPQWGDPPHAFRKAHDPISDGQVYVRKKARSVPPDHKDILRLAQRYAARRQGSELDVSVVIGCPLALPCCTWTGDDLESLLGAQRDYLMAPLLKERARNTGARSPAFGAALQSTLWAGARVSLTIPEHRAEGAYEAEVTAYLDQLRTSWPAIMREAAALLIPAPEFKAVNQTDRNFRALEVKVTVTGAADAVKRNPDAGDLNLLDLLPKAPRVWGANSLGFGLGRDAHYAAFLQAVPVPQTSVERDGGFTLTFPPVDLRPRQTRVLERNWAVLIPVGRPDPVTAEWTATSVNADGRASGQVTMTFDGPDVNLFESLLQTAVQPQQEP